MQQVILYDAELQKGDGRLDPTLESCLTPRLVIEPRGADPSFSMAPRRPQIVHMLSWRSDERVFRRTAMGVLQGCLLHGNSVVSACQG